MKKIRHIYSTLTFIAFAILFWASSTQQLAIQTLSQTSVTYEKVDRDTTSLPYNVSYTMPVFKLIGNTSQNQTINGITILCDVNLFQAIRTTTVEKEVATADPDKPGYDIYKLATKPSYTITPERVTFTIKIINNMDFPIELTNVPIIFKKDGISYTLPEVKTKWNDAIAAGGETTTFSILGPTRAELESAKNVIVQIQNIPTSYDKENGKLKNYESFKWMFELQNQTISKIEKITYSYDESPVYKEPCTKCNGTGQVKQQTVCSKCKGTKQLKYTNYTTGQSWVGNCDKCNGTGTETILVKCSLCSGNGKISYPKSQQPAIKSSTTWSGWKVQVITTPPGAAIQVLDISTSAYTNIGLSNATVNWYSTLSKSYPIILTYNDKSVKVLPYKTSGEKSATINVDFSKGEPVIKIGTKVN
jgi:hypothetical protein